MPADPGTTASTTGPSGDSSTSQSSGSTGSVTSTTSAPEGSSTTGSSSDTSSSETADPQPVLLDVEATVAECLTDGSPSTDDCAPDVGRFVVDGNPAPARTGYLRFDVPSPPEASSIVELRLELTPPEGCLICDGKATGDVYAVEPFTADSLNMAPPAVQAVLAPGAGPVVNGEAIEIALPTDVLGPDGTLFVSLVPTSADEVHFWSTSGLAPPRLRIVAMP